MADMTAEPAGPTEDHALPCHQAIVNDRIPLSIGGGIGQDQPAPQGPHREVSVGANELMEICSERNIHVPI